MPQTNIIPENRFARLIARKVSEYFMDPEHRKEFEDDYKKRTGNDYVWKTLADIENENNETAN